MRMLQLRLVSLTCPSMIGPATAIEAAGGSTEDRDICVVGGVHWHSSMLTAHLVWRLSPFCWECEVNKRLALSVGALSAISLVAEGAAPCG